MPTFSLLTFNCFGVPALATRRRLLTLARELNQHPESVVCLQEVQAHMYRRLLIQACDPYTSCAYEQHLHAPKGGLLTLSRLHFDSTEFMLYRDRGLWYTPAVTDWILHKGILCTRMHCGTLTVVVLNTHLTANYRGDWRSDNRYTRNERCQLQQLAETVRAQPADSLVLVAGDFNVPRGSGLYHEFIADSGLVDPLAGNTQPTLRLIPGMPQRYAQPIDFALFRAPDHLTGFQAHSHFRFQDKMAFIGGDRGYLSDHTAIALHLTWTEHSTEGHGVVTNEEKAAG